MFAALAIGQSTPDQQTQKPNEGGQSSATSGVNSGGPHAAVLDDQHRPITAGGFVKTGPIVFEDIADKSRLNKWQHQIGTLEKKYILETVGSGVCLLDYDNDGWLDIYLVNGSTYDAVSGKTTPPHAALFHNNHDGTFTDVTTIGGVANDRWGFRVARSQSRPSLSWVGVPASSTTITMAGSSRRGNGPSKVAVARGLANGDIFNDGRIDAVVNNVDGTPSLFRNVSVQQNHWTGLKLVGGPHSPRDAVGTTVYLTANGIRQRQDVLSGGSFASSSDQRLHFGLGSATKIDSVQVHWPSGLTEQITLSGIDTVRTIMEGKGAAHFAEKISRYTLSMRLQYSLGVEEAMPHNLEDRGQGREVYPSRTSDRGRG